MNLKEKIEKYVPYNEKEENEKWVIENVYKKLNEKLNLLIKK